MKRILYFFILLFFSALTAISQPAITGVLVPQYMCDTTRGIGENARTHVVLRAKITGLTPNATYRYQTKPVSLFYINGVNPAFDGPTSTGAGNALYLRQSGSFTMTSSPSLATFGAYDSLLANASGEYEGWFGFEPTANARFAPGNYIHPRVILNSGVTGNTTNTYYLTVSDSIKTLTYGTATTNNGTGVWSHSQASDRNIAVLWDNVSGSGRPLSCAIVESDGVNMRSFTSPGNYPLYLRNNVDSFSGAWGTIIPNSNANGVRRVDNRKLSDGTLVYANLDADGIWPTGSVSTVNPAGGYTAIKLDSNDVPLVPNPTLFFEQTTYSVNENGTSVIVGVKYKNPSLSSTNIDVVLKTGGSATTGTDFTFSTVTLTFTALDTMKTITIPITNDIFVEGNETFILGLGNATNGALIGADSVSTISIIDDDFTAPVFLFNATSYSIAESGPSVTVAVKYKNPASLPTSVDVALKLGGTATSGTDFTFATTTLNFTSTDTMKTFVIPITNDLLVEGTETFTLRLANQTAGCVLSIDSTTTITILDDDFAPPVVSFVATKQTVVEGTVAAIITVKLSAKALAAASVAVSAVNGTATAADYTYSNTTLNFAIGDSVKTITVAITDDAIVEAAETFYIQLSNPTGATLGNASDTITINDNDYPRYTIGQIASVNAITGVADSLGKKYDEVGVVYGINYRPAGLQFVIRDNTGGITVFKATGNYGYSVKEGDSVRVPGTVAQFNGLTEFNADTVIVVGTNKAIKTPTVIAKLVEANENDLVRIKGVQFDVPMTTWPTAAANISVHTATDTIMIRLQLANSDILGTAAPVGLFDIIGLGSQFDNSNPYTSGYQLFPRFLSDIIPTPPAIITVDSSAISVNENAGTAKMKLKISNVNGAAATINISNLGTATSGTDYTAPGATVTFPASAQNGDSIMVTYTITDDVLVEGNETILVGISAGSNSKVVGASKVITIVDNDFAPATIKIDTTTLSVNENAGTVKVKVKISNVNGTATTATLAFTGTASVADYTAPSATITFPANAANGDSIMVSYTIIDDAIYEPLPETIITTYTSGTNCVISGASVQTIKIVDNDPNGINKNSKNSSVQVFPNPSNGTFTIRSNNELKSVKVLDILGHEVAVSQPIGNVISMQSMAAGVYIVIVETNAGITSQRVIVK